MDIAYPTIESFLKIYKNCRTDWNVNCLQQFSINPVGIFSLKDTLKIYKGKKIRKISKPSDLSLNPLFKK